MNKRQTVSGVIQEFSVRDFLAWSWKDKQFNRIILLCCAAAIVLIVGITASIRPNVVDVQHVDAKSAYIDISR